MSGTVLPRGSPACRQVTVTKELQLCPPPGGGGVFSLPKATVVVAGNRENIAGFLSQRSGGGGTVQNGAGIRANAFHG